jgi:phenylpyruvate tautomerase PptA (4-oxalocrotonate tautomerase family)
MENLINEVTEAIVEQANKKIEAASSKENA